MKENFTKDFIQFKTKLDSFLISTNFNSKCKEYENMLDEINSIPLDAMKDEIKNSLDFQRVLEQSHSLMQKIVLLYKELDNIFKMDEKSLGELTDYNIETVEEIVTKHLREAASLIHQFDAVSAKSRKIIEALEDPFIYQGM